MPVVQEDHARAAYDALAPFYDRLTQGYEYGRWLGSIEARAASHGLTGTRLLDVGCGTGKSFLPMIELGYEVTGCDISPEMVELAQEAVAGTDARVVVADMRALPVLGRFDLVTAIDDALNYLATDDELESAFAGVARNLRPGGFFVFDLNTLACYRHHFSRDSTAEVDGTSFSIRGLADPESVMGGGTFSAVIEVFSTDEGGRFGQRCSSLHTQRHHPPRLVRRLLEKTGFELVDRCGLEAGAYLVPVGDENVHTKLDYFARRLPRAAPNRRFTHETAKGGDPT